MRYDMEGVLRGLEYRLAKLSPEHPQGFVIMNLKEGDVLVRGVRGLQAELAELRRELEGEVAAHREDNDRGL